MNVDILICMKQELVIFGIVLLLLVLKIRQREEEGTSFLHLMNCLLLVQFLTGLFFPTKGILFGGMYETNTLLSTEKNILHFGVLLISLLSFEWLKTHHNRIEFYLLLLSSLLGMDFLISSRHLLLFYISLELTTIPIAVLVNFNLKKREASEAAFKLILSSAFSSGLMLLGISLLYGATGNLYMENLIQFSASGNVHSTLPLYYFSIVLLLAGFGFKLSIVPFHWWTADVYTGAPVPVTAFLSVISKTAVVMALIPFLYHSIADLQEIAYDIIIVLAIATMIIGNLFAIRQENLKRLLAFSSISQIGFILTGLSAFTTESFAATLYFLIVYMCSNLLVFGSILMISKDSGNELLINYKGLYKTHPHLSWCIAIGLFSLAGIPPAAGFFGKFFLLLAAAGKSNYWLLGVAVASMVVALYYYLRVIRVLFMDEPAETFQPFKTPLSAKLALLACLVVVGITGIGSGLYEYLYSLIILH